MSQRPPRSSKDKPCQDDGVRDGRDRNNVEDGAFEKAAVVLLTLLGGRCVKPQYLCRKPRHQEPFSRNAKAV